jgi:hypothetical protein
MLRINHATFSGNSFPTAPFVAIGGSLGNGDPELRDLKKPFTTTAW